MTHAKTEHAASAAAVSLIVMCGSIACMLPPLNERFLDSPIWLVTIGVAITVSLVLHLIFVGILARSLGKSAAWYVTLAVFTLPIGSIVGLVLLEWARKLSPPERNQGTA